MFAGIAVAPPAVDVGHLPRIAAVGGVVRPQFTTCASIVCREIECVADKEFHGDSRVAVARTAVDVLHSPCRVIGSIVRPQFGACALIVCGEIDGITNEGVHAPARFAVACTAPDVRYEP